MLDRRMLARPVAVRDLPKNLPRIHVDGADAAVRRFEERQPTRSCGPPEPLAFHVAQVRDGWVAELDVRGERCGCRRHIQDARVGIDSTAGPIRTSTEPGN